MHDLAQAVAGIVGDHAVSTAPVDRVSYARDMWPRDQLAVQGGELPPGPAVIAWPANREEVARLVELANQRGVPIVPYGGGSGVCGGARANDDVLIIDVKRMDTLHGVDAERLIADVDVGINGEWLERGLNHLGYTLGHFPSSIWCSTLGGFIAARSAGQLSTKYGKIEDMVSALDLVLPTGASVDLTEWDAAAGADLNQLFTGSEGTLGVMTRASLKVHPLADERELMGFEFADLDSGLAAIQQMLQSGLRPAVVRLYDEFDTVLALSGGSSTGNGDDESLFSLLNPKKAASSFLGLFPSLGKAALSLALAQPRVLNTIADRVGGRCLMVLMFEGAAKLTAAEARDASRICVEAGAKDLGPGPAEHWLERRYSVSFKQSKVFAAGAFNDTAEVAGTWDVLPNLYRSVKRAIGRHAFVMAHFSHAYHEGCSIYFTFVGNARDLESSQELYDNLWSDLLEATVEAGGTISHHHGVGRSKAHYLPDELGPGGMELLHNIKGALDPKTVLNVGSLGLHSWTQPKKKESAASGRKSAFEQELSALLGPENLREDRLARSFLGASGEEVPEDVVIARPGAASEVVELMRLVHAYRIPVVLAGTSGRNLHVSWPDGYFVVLDTARLDRVLAVDDESLTVTAQAGISWNALEQQLGEQGFTLGVRSTGVGDNVSVGGLLSTGMPPVGSPKYGSAHEAVVNLGFVSADGTRVRTKLTPRSATGPDLKSLAMGGRGAVAIITGVTLRVYRRPDARHSLAARFDSAAAALSALESALRAGSRPADCDIADDVLFVTVEGTDTIARVERDVVRDAMRSGGKLLDDIPNREEREPPSLIARGSLRALGRARIPGAVYRAFNMRGGYVLGNGTNAGDDLIVLRENGRPAPFSPGTLDVLRAIKNEIDPDDLLNRGQLS